MALLKIARMGHPVLRRRAGRIDDVRCPVLARLVCDMVETMIDAGGVGLAAPQVHESVRLILFRVPAHRADDGREVSLSVLINPEIEPLDEAMEQEGEGCLSLPGMMGIVPRWKRILYRGTGLDGKKVEREAAGFHARVVQHECDHLDGVLYPSRMADLSLFGFAEELAAAEGGVSERERGTGP